MHSGGNRRWVPLSFENNNNKRYRAHIFYFTISASVVSSIQLHSRGQILPFSQAENPRPPSPVWTTYCGVSRSSGKKPFQANLEKSTFLVAGFYFIPCIPFCTFLPAYTLARLTFYENLLIGQETSVHCVHYQVTSFDENVKCFLQRERKVSVLIY